MVMKKKATYLCVFLLGMSCVCLSACSETEDVQEEQNTVNTEDNINQQDENNTETDGEEYFSEEVIGDTDILDEATQESGVVDEVEIIEDTTSDDYENTGE